MAPGLAIGQAVGRWGNFVNQEAFGTITSLPWGMSSENTSFFTVHPCFLYESLGCIFIFFILHFCSHSLIKKPGNLFLIYTALYGLLRSFIEPLRTDSLVIPNTQIKISQALAILLFLTSTVFLIASVPKQKKISS